MKIRSLLIASMILCGSVLQSSAKTTLLSEDFEGLNHGDSFGVNVTISNATYNTGMRLRNPVLATNIAPNAAFTTASGTNVLQVKTLTDASGGYGNLALNPTVPVSLNLGDTIRLSFDMYVQAIPATASGLNFQIRGSGIPNTTVRAFTELSTASVGLVTNVVMEYEVDAAMAPATALDVWIPWEGVPDNFTTPTDIAQIDNYVFEIIPYVPPVTVVTGTFVDTDFTATDGYSDIDLAGQTNWMQVAGSSNNAFSVIDSATTGAADTATTGNHSTNTGNAVYWSDATFNASADAWGGYFDFQVSAAATPINNQDVLVFGITSDEDAALKLEGAENDQMALMSLKVRANGKMVAMFGEEGNDNDDIRLATLIGQTETGWDPANATTPDLTSDVIRYTWSIRKTTEEGTYQASGSLSNITTGVAHVNTQATVPSVLLSKQTMYSSPLAFFTMGHYYKAQLNPDSELVDVKILAMSTSHSTNNLPVANPPSGVVTEASDRAVMISWDPTLEVTSYDVLMAETQGGEQMVVASGLTDLSTIDSPRFNGITNWYTVQANYPNGIAFSDEVPGAPEASQSLINFDGINREMVTANVDWTRPDEGDNGSLFWFGSDTTPVITNGQGTYVGPSLHAFVQNPGNTNFGVTLVQNNGSSSSYSDIDWIGVTSQFEDPRARQHMLVYVKKADWGNTDSVDLTTDSAELNIGSDYCNGDYGMQAAIRNGSQWYVSERAAYAKWSAPQSNIVVNLATENWAAIGSDPSVAWPNPNSLSYATIDTNAFTDINAVGYYCYEDFNARVNQLILSKGGSTPSFEWWAGNEGVPMVGNTDGDDLDNIKEYAFGGDPNVADAFYPGGGLPEFTAATYMGIEGFTFVSVELRDPQPGIDYALETSDNLTTPGSWGADASMVELGSAEIDYYYKSVTNFIPIDDAVKFIDLKVTETP